ncbi:MAG TPA: restriction endonuclease [Verrucomicrobiae bacterium]|nr:restriction endonuclease [Verrucomicrobiae bacterium]
MSNKPYYKRPYSRRSRQATTGELTATLIIAVVLAVAVLAATTATSLVILLVTTLVFVACIVAVAMGWTAFRRHQKMRAIELSSVDAMDGFVFEKYVEQLLKNQGYQNVRLTEKYDLGIDAIADRDGERWGIQIKRNRGKTKAESVRQAVTALNHYKCSRAMVVSNSQFTGAAKQLADSNNCVLIDRGQLGQWIVDFQKGPKK